ncbi:hypothetical protein J4399_03395 [Candidatus Woesearchaeota archaeon]|nr:hypothetical protein [Candidatus Woesearchaeota archaeon]
MSAKPFINKINYARMPTLETYIMVKGTIRKFSGEFNRRQLWLKLPRKVMWQTYCLTIDYLLHENMIAVDRKGVIGWIYNPELARYYLRRKDLSWKPRKSNSGMKRRS